MANRGRGLGVQPFVPEVTAIHASTGATGELAAGVHAAHHELTRVGAARVGCGSEATGGRSLGPSDSNDRGCAWRSPSRPDSVAIDPAADQTAARLLPGAAQNPGAVPAVGAAGTDELGTVVLQPVDKRSVITA